MTDTWLPFCIKRPGPLNKRGYDGIPTRTLAEVEGEVKHSMEGYMAGAEGRLMAPLTSDPYTQASWHISVPKLGPPVQYYPLEATCWHAGLPGDRRFDTSLVGNLTLIGEEHEDAPTNVLNADQIHWSSEISKAVRSLCPRVAAKPPALGVNLWEHRMLSATSCPSGLIPWPTILAALKEEEMALTQAEFNKMFLEAAKSLKYPARDDAGKETSGGHTAAQWAEAAHLARKEIIAHAASLHAAGGGVDIEAIVAEIQRRLAD